MTPLQLILQIIAAGAAVAQPLSTASPEAQAIEAAAAALVQIAQNALIAYQQVAGKPMDLDSLQPIDPVA